MIERTVEPPQNTNQQNLMPSDAAWQGSRSSVEKNKGGGGTTNRIKSSLNRLPFTPDNYFGGGGTTRPPGETNWPNVAKLNFPWIK